MNLAELIKERDELAEKISRIASQNQRADWSKYTVSTRLLRKQLDDLTWRILEYENPDAYRLEMESRERRNEHIRRERKRQMDRLPTLDDALKLIREKFGRKE